MVDGVRDRDLVAHDLHLAGCRSGVLADHGKLTHAFGQLRGTSGHHCSTEGRGRRDHARELRRKVQQLGNTQRNRQICNIPRSGRQVHRRICRKYENLGVLIRRHHRADVLRGCQLAGWCISRFDRDVAVDTAETHGLRTGTHLLGRISDLTVDERKECRCFGSERRVRVGATGERRKDSLIDGHGRLDQRKDARRRLRVPDQRLQ